MAIEMNASGKGKIEARNNHDVMFYYDANKEGVIKKSDGTEYKYKGVVVAKAVDAYMLLPHDENYKMQAKCDSSVDTLLYHEYTSLYLDNMNRKIGTAVSYCSVNDTFDLLTGMKVAKQKLMKKYANMCQRVLAEEVEHLESIVAALKDELVKYSAQ